MAALSITHTRAEGTLITGTARGDGTAEILKAAGWRWGRSIARWYVPYSRDKKIKTHAITPAVTALKAAGHTVTVEVDDTARPAAEVEADVLARQEQRAEAMAARAQRKRAAAAAAGQAADRTAAALPPGGEPIKIGHHSEGRHRRAIERAWNATGKAVAARSEAHEADRVAAIAQRATAARYSVATVANRIARLEAEGRALSRQLAGYTADRGTPYAEAIPAATGRRREAITADLKENRDQLTYWQAVRAQQVQDGATAEYGPETIHPGDKIRAAGTWWTVARVNKVTCSVWADPGRRVLSSYRVRYTQVSEHRPG